MTWFLSGFLFRMNTWDSFDAMGSCGGGATSIGTGPGRTATWTGKTPRRRRRVSFRDQTGIYVLYDGGKIVYIGQVGSSERGLYWRLKHHTKDELADRWDKFSWFGTRAPLTPSASERDSDLQSGKQRHRIDSNIVLDHLEGLLLAVVEPVLNRQGSKWQNQATRFVQHRNVDDLGPSEQEMIRRIHDSIESPK